MSASYTATFVKSSCEAELFYQNAQSVCHCHSVYNT